MSRAQKSKTYEEASSANFESDTVTTQQRHERSSGASGARLAHTNGKVDGKKKKQADDRSGHLSSSNNSERSSPMLRRPTKSSALRNKSIQMSHGGIELPLTQKSRGRILSSMDEAHVVGAWVTFHLLVDSMHSRLRTTLRHWWSKFHLPAPLIFRACKRYYFFPSSRSLYRLANPCPLFAGISVLHDLKERNNAVSKLEDERGEVLTKLQDLEAKKNKLDSEEGALVENIMQEKARADTVSAQLRETEDRCATLEEKLKSSDERESHMKLQYEALQERFVGLLGSAASLSKLSNELAAIKPLSSADVLHCIAEADADADEELGETAAALPTAQKSATARTEKKRTFTEDLDLFTERRRRSHLASPSIHAVPNSTFLDSCFSIGGSFTKLFSGYETGRKSLPAPVQDDADKQHDGEEDLRKAEEASAMTTEQQLASSSSSSKSPPRPKNGPVTTAAASPHSSSVSNSNKSTNRIRPKYGPVRPSRSSVIGERKKSVGINDTDEALWEKIKQPGKNEGLNTVAVAVRVRPFNKREKDMGAELCVQMSNQSIALVEPTSKETTTFTFDYIFDTFDPSHPQYANQDTVFADLGIDILRQAWDGYNACLFAYGQTGSGKSWSITGSHEQPGIIPLFCDKLFYFIEKHPLDDTEFSVQCSFLEIYNERVQDLLNPDGSNLKVREHPITGVFVEGLSYCAVDCYDDVEVLMEEGTAARTIGATNMNASSSRSHSIFEIVITQEFTDPATKQTSEKQSRVVLIDLAGSERAGSTGATGTRLKEGAQINKSLSALGQCIRSLADAAASKSGQLDLKKVPFRNSVLTMLLKNSLAGNSKTTMLAAVSPADVNYSESLSTLRYAQSAKKIATKAVVTQDPTAKLIKELREEVQRLKSEMENGRGEGGDAVMEVEALLLEKSMSKEAKRQQTDRLKKRRQTILAMTGIGSGDAQENLKKYPHLSNLNDDPSLSGTLKLIIADGTIMKIGRKDSEEPQDVQLEGLGMKKSHCIIENESGGGIYISCRESGANVYVNGSRLGDNSRVKLKHKDVLVLGVCTHIYQLIIPDSKSKPEDGGEGESEELGGDSRGSVSYQSAVRQVVLGRPETEEQKQVRLAHLVLANWRRPVFRRMFEERLVESMRFCQEANEIANLMYAKVKFNINLSCAVHLEDAASISLREIIKYEHVNINVRAHKVGRGDAVKNDSKESDSSDDEDDEDDENRMSSSKDWMCECGRAAFGQFLDMLRNDYNSMKPFCLLVGADSSAGATDNSERRCPAIVRDLFGEVHTEVTFAQLYSHLKSIRSHDIDIKRDLLVENVQQVTRQELRVVDGTLLDKDEVTLVVQNLLKSAFHQCMEPLLAEFGRNTAGGWGRTKLRDLEIVQDMLLNLIESGEQQRSALLTKIADEFDSIKSGMRDVRASLESDALERLDEIERIEIALDDDGEFHRPVSVASRASKGRELLTGERGFAMAKESLGTPPQQAAARQEEAEAEKMAGTDAFADVGANADASREEDGDGASDWEIAHDNDGRQYFWSESRGESKWADEDSAEEALADRSEAQDEQFESAAANNLVDFDDLSEDHFDLEGRIEQSDELHVYGESEEEIEHGAGAEKDGDIRDEGDGQSDDWQIMTDEETGRDYWWSDSRGEAKWVEEEDVHEAAGTAGDDDLEVHEDSEGRQYLFNTRTGESKWLVEE